MFDAIDRSITDLGAPKYAEHHAAKFQGYDGNNEGKFLRFTAYTVERLERFKYVKVANEGTWNSHMPVRDMYLRMLEVWRTIGKPSNVSMSESELVSVFAASIHPDNRELKK